MTPSTRPPAPRRRRSPGFSLAEVLFAALLLAIVVGPLIYFFSAADRQAWALEGFYTAQIRARLEAGLARWKGRSEGFEPGVREIPAGAPGEIGALPAPGRLTLEAVEGRPGLHRIGVRVPWGRALLGTHVATHEELVLDPAVCLSGVAR